MRTVLVLGGSSDIAASVCASLSLEGPLHVILAGRSLARMNDVAALLARRGARVELVEFDAVLVESHREKINSIFARLRVDVALVAFGILGDHEQIITDPIAAAHLMHVNFVGAAVSGMLLADAMSDQGYGTIVFLSSVAGERPRRSNFVYGSSKAGADFFYRGLARQTSTNGVRILVVRPGQVRTKMTAGRPEQPFTTESSVVASAIVRALKNRRVVVRVPFALKLAIPALRLLPDVIYRRIAP